MTRYGMNGLRMTATLAHALPGLAVRLRHGDRTLLTSCRPPAPAADGSGGGDGEWLPPCAFRATVGAALDLVRAGRIIGVLGLEPGVDPRVELGGCGGTKIHTGGIVSSMHERRLVHAFATLLAPPKVRNLMECGPPSPLGDHYDEITDVSLVFSESTPHPSTSDSTIVSVMQDLLVRCAGAELALDLVPTATGGSPL